MEKKLCKLCGYYFEDEDYCEYWGDVIKRIDDCDKFTTNTEEE